MRRPRPGESAFRCRSCSEWHPYTELNIDADDVPVCNDCYLENPPPEDVDGVFAEVIAHMDVTR
jgi:hypothetical protein